MTPREHKVRALKVLAIQAWSVDPPDALNGDLSEEEIDKAHRGWRSVAADMVERVRKTAGNSEWNPRDGWESAPKQAQKKKA